MKKGIIALIFINLFLSSAVFAQVDIPIPQGIIQVVDNFENGNYWIWAGSDWDKYGGHKSSCGATLSKQHVSEGKYSMELMLEPINPGASATWFYDGDMNLAGAKYIVADFYNPGPITFVTAFVMQCTNNWNWNQSEMFNIPPGKHTVVFDVRNINKDFNDIKRINVTSYFYQENKDDTSLFIDNIRAIK